MGHNVLDAVSFEIALEEGEVCGVRLEGHDLTAVHAAREGKGVQTDVCSDDVLPGRACSRSTSRRYPS